MFQNLGKQCLTYSAFGFTMPIPCEHSLCSWCIPSPGVPGAHENLADMAECEGVGVFSVSGGINAEHFSQCCDMFLNPVDSLSPSCLA